MRNIFHNKEVPLSDWASQSDRTQAALRSFVDLINPDRDEHAAREIAEIKTALADRGNWSRQDEWRISTWTSASIDSEDRPDGKTWFRVTVECDGQTLSCRCPTPERAFVFYRLYAHLIVYQFYGIGPPWAG